MLGAVVLVRCVPDRPAGAQQLEHAAHVLALDGQRIKVVPLAAAALNVVEHRVAVLAVHAVDGVLLTEQGRANFQGSEV
ncbi:hypothetical protein D3C84_716840 [compost metagenome]